MQLLTRSSNLITLTLQLSLFVGLLFVAGISLLSLSPVAYEDYLKYKNNQYAVEQINPPEQVSRLPQVAGIETATPTNFTNLVAEQQYTYKYTSDNKSSLLQLTNNNMAGIDLVRVANQSPLAKDYQLELNQGPTSNSYNLVDSNNATNLELITTNASVSKSQVSTSKIFRLHLPSNTSTIISLAKNTDIDVKENITLQITQI